MANKECPCRYCVPPKRNAECHSTCPEYKEWNDERLSYKAKISEARHSEFVSDPTTVKKHIRRRR